MLERYDPDRTDHQLLAAARRILAEAGERGQRVGKAGLGRLLREQGFTIANARITELLNAAGQDQGDEHARSGV